MPCGDGTENIYEVCINAELKSQSFVEMEDESDGDKRYQYGYQFIPWLHPASLLELTYDLGDEKTNTLGVEFELSVDALP